MTETTAQLLVVDDDPDLLDLLIEELGNDGHRCTKALSGQEALLEMRQTEFDLVILDWNLPDFEGVEICQRMRKSQNTTPVLMLTAHDSVIDRVKALDIGADDYLTKPFEIEELKARARAQLRRISYSSQQLQSLELGELQIDLVSHRVRQNNKDIHLSQREFKLLTHLVENAGVVLPRQQILESVWGKPFIGDPNTLDVYVGYLRKKLEQDGNPRLLHTVRGVGYVAKTEK